MHCRIHCCICYLVKCACYVVLHLLCSFFLMFVLYATEKDTVIIPNFDCYFVYFFFSICQAYFKAMFCYLSWILLSIISSLRVHPHYNNKNSLFNSISISWLKVYFLGHWYSYSSFLTVRTFFPSFYFQPFFASII